MPAPICLNCRRTMACEKNGFYIRDIRPYVIATDVYRCNECGARVISGFSKLPLKVSEAQYEAAIDVDQPGETP